MNIPRSNPVPDDPDNLPPARRRRVKRLLAPLEGDERAAEIDALASRASPSYDFFVFSLLSGFVFSAGLMLDAPGILLLGALLAPLSAPIIGMALGTVTGSGIFFLRSLGGLIIGGGLTFGAGALSGFVTQWWEPASLEQAYLNAQLSWLNLGILAIGAIFTAALMAHRSRRAMLPGVALAYGLYLPLTIAGFGLTSRTPHLWPDGLVVFLIHMSWGAALAALTLALLGFRPLTLLGYTVGGALALVGVVLAIGMSSAGAAFGVNIALPTYTPSPTSTITPSLTPSLTPPPPTQTPTLTPVPPTLTPTRTPTLTLTPTPTPVFAMVIPAEGAILRAEPGGLATGGYTAGTVVEILSLEPVQADGRNWILVRGPDGNEGWILEPLLTIVTPTLQP
jgi:hypothetical protein